MKLLSKVAAVTAIVALVVPAAFAKAPAASVKTKTPVKAAHVIKSSAKIAKAKTGAKVKAVKAKTVKPKVTGAKKA